MTIGEKAAHAIAERSEKNGTTIREELAIMGIDVKSYYLWKKGSASPCAHFLQQMLFNGYDVLWILRGGEDGNQPAEVSE